MVFLLKNVLYSRNFINDELVIKQSFNHENRINTVLISKFRIIQTVQQCRNKRAGNSIRERLFSFFYITGGKTLGSIFCCMRRAFNNMNANRPVDNCISFFKKIASGPDSLNNRQGKIILLLFGQTGIPGLFFQNKMLISEFSGAHDDKISFIRPLLATIQSCFRRHTGRRPHTRLPKATAGKIRYKPKAERYME